MNHDVLCGLILGLNLITIIDFRLFHKVNFLLSIIFYLTLLQIYFNESTKLILLNNIIMGLMTPFSISSGFLSISYLYCTFNNVNFEKSIYVRK